MAGPDVHPRSFLGQVSAGITASVALAAALVWGKPLPPDKAQGPNKESQLGATVSQWNLRVVRRVTIASGGPRHRAFPAAVKLQNGDLLVAYREGTDHWRTKDGMVRLVRSRDGGKSWSEPKTVWSIPGHNLGTHDGLSQLANGAVLLPVQDVFKIDSQPWSIKAYMMRSADNGQTWSKPEEPNTAALSRFHWFNTYGRIFQLKDGTVFWGVGCHKKGDDWPKLTTGLLVSRDNGRTWPEYRQVATGLDEEKSVIALSSGSWLAIIRATPSAATPQYFYKTYSHDNGLTWSPPARTNIQGHSPHLHRAASGALLLAHRALQSRPEGEAGYPAGIGVGMAVSFDEGNTWHPGGLIYASPQPGRDTGYPSMVQLNDKEILCVYYTAFNPKTRSSDIEGAFLAEGLGAAKK